MTRIFSLALVLCLFLIPVSTAYAAGTTTHSTGTGTSVIGCWDDKKAKERKCECEGVSECMDLDDKGLCESDFVCDKSNHCTCDWKKPAKRTDDLRQKLQTSSQVFVPKTERGTVRDQSKTSTSKNTKVVADKKKDVRDHRPKVQAASTAKGNNKTPTSMLSAPIPQNPGTGLGYDCAIIDGEATCDCEGVEECKRMKDDKVCAPNPLTGKSMSCTDEFCICIWNIDKRTVRDHRTKPASTPDKVK